MGEWKNINNNSNDNKNLFFTECSKTNKCNCINCMVPRDIWLKIGMSLNNDVMNDYLNLAKDHENTNENINENINENENINKNINGNNNNDNKIINDIFHKTYIFKKNVKVDDFFNTIKIHKFLNIETIYENGEIIVSNIIDNLYFTNLLIYKNNDKSVEKIKITSNAYSDLKKNIIEQLFNNQIIK